MQDVFFSFYIKREAPPDWRRFSKDWRRLTLPRVTVVPSALWGLTSLFGMGRGVHPCYNHHLFLRHTGKNITCKFILSQITPTDLTRTGKLRVISTAQLNTSLHLHLQPIYVVISYDPLKISHLVASFALRCFQCLSLPNIATQQCNWRHNWYTSGSSDSVLSY